MATSGHGPQWDGTVPRYAEKPAEQEAREHKGKGEQMTDSAYRAPRYIVVNATDEAVDVNGFTRDDYRSANWRAMSYDKLKEAEEMANKFTLKNEQSYGVVELKFRFVYQPTVNKQVFG